MLRVGQFGAGLGRECAAGGCVVCGCVCVCVSGCVCVWVCVGIVLLCVEGIKCGASVRQVALWWFLSASFELL